MCNAAGSKRANTVRKNMNAELRGGAYKCKPVEYAAAETAASANDKCQRLLGVGQERETPLIKQRRCLFH